MNNIKEILIKNNFVYKKGLGQNFITDKNLLDSIVADSGINENDTVLEIGAGAGSLTQRLSKKAKRVIAFEIDENLKPILQESLSECHNVEIFFKDILKTDAYELKNIISSPFKVVANLPYYITTPIIMFFIENEKNFDLISLTVMVQKEVALRICAKENTPDYGAITVSVGLRGDATIKRIVDKTMFFPIPKVDSAILHINIHNRYKISKTTNKLIRSAFQMRRKTLVNNLISAFPISKSDAIKLIEKQGFQEKIRGEVLSVNEFFRLSNAISEWQNTEK